jgi:hypothetical protein
MTAKPIRREFLKTAAVLGATLTLKPKANAETAEPFALEQNPGPVETHLGESNIVLRAMKSWHPHPDLKITGLKIGVSEDARFIWNELLLRIEAETELQPPTSDVHFGFCACLRISRNVLASPKEFTRALHRTLNSDGVFHWVQEGHPIPMV